MFVNSVVIGSYFLLVCFDLVWLLVWCLLVWLFCMWFDVSAWMSCLVIGVIRCL